jgi:hypothetical protein
MKEITNKGYFETSIDAAKCVTDRGMLEQFSLAFSFPESSFSNSGNYGAILGDFITDLSWIKQRNFKLLVNNARKFEKLDSHKQRNLLHTLCYIREHWQEMRRIGQNNSENNFLIEFDTNLWYPELRADMFQ